MPHATRTPTTTLYATVPTTARVPHVRLVLPPQQQPQPLDLRRPRATTTIRVAVISPRLAFARETPTSVVSRYASVVLYRVIRARSQQPRLSVRLRVSTRKPIVSSGTNIAISCPIRISAQELANYARIIF